MKKECKIGSLYMHDIQYTLSRIENNLFDFS